jgi:MFS family permease
VKGTARLDHHGRPIPDHYKWIALSNTTLGMAIATINASILLISLPSIFRGIDVDPLKPSNTNYLLWLILGFLVVTAVLVVSLGRLGDIYGRARTYNLGFAVFTLFSILLSVTWMKGTDGALWLIVMRALQGVGGAMLFANSSAIITDAFPEDQRGLALGINGVAAVAGSSVGLVLGGVLAPVDWRAVFLVSVPFGVFGTVWGFAKLRDLSERKPAKIDWLGNVTFAVGLVAVMVGITYGIQPYGAHTMGWTSPKVLGEIGGGVLMLIVFCFVETRVEQPMFHLDLFKVRAFSAGNIAQLLSGIGRGGLQFVLIIWLQGIYLPRHGYSFSETPLWAGIYLLPLVAGMLIAGPVAGALSDRIGPRPFAVSGMLLAAISFLLLARRDGGDVHELRDGALDRGLLHADDRRALRRAARLAVHRLARPRRLLGERHQGGEPATRLDPVRCLPRLQPRQDAARPRGPARCLGGPAARPARAHVLPVDHLAPVLECAFVGVHLRSGRLPAGRPCLGDPGQVRSVSDSYPAQAAGGPLGRAADDHPRRRHARVRRRRRERGQRVGFRFVLDP